VTFPNPPSPASYQCKLLQRGPGQAPLYVLLLSGYSPLMWWAYRLRSDQGTRGGVALPSTPKKTQNIENQTNVSVVLTIHTNGFMALICKFFSLLSQCSLLDFRPVMSKYLAARRKIQPFVKSNILVGPGKIILAGVGNMQREDKELQKDSLHTQSFDM
jgi:hypothetical protein